MKHFYIAIVLALSSGNAVADWALMSMNIEFLVYADGATSQRIGNIVRMWTMRDRFSSQIIEDQAYLSSEMQNEYDCKEKKWRQIYVLRYSGRMGAGRVFPFHTLNVNWESVLPGTIVDAEWLFACKKR